MKKVMYLGLSILLLLQPGMQSLPHGLLMMSVASYLGWTFTDVWWGKNVSSS